MLTTIIALILFAYAGYILLMNIFSGFAHLICALMIRDDVKGDKFKFSFDNNLHFVSPIVAVGVFLLLL